MKLEQEKSRTTYSITSYSTGLIEVNREPVAESFVITPKRLVRPWPPADFEQLNAEHLELVAELRPEVVLLGTGAEQRFPATELLLPLISRGIGFEVMSTGSACRTFNLLASEGRNVAAAMLMIRE